MKEACLSFNSTISYFLFSFAVFLLARDLYFTFFSLSMVAITKRVLHIAYNLRAIGVLWPDRDMTPTRS